MRRWTFGAWLVAALLLSACAEPPNKEMDQAQGAIDAARAAGADCYASSEYTAAATALKNANDAVAQGDYRLALNYALDSREHAQNAAREAADTKARLRAEVERDMTELATLLAQASNRLAAVQRTRTLQRVVQGPAEEIAAVNSDVQKVAEAIKADDYLAAQAGLKGVKQRIEKAITALDAAATSQSSRRRR